MAIADPIPPTPPAGGSGQGQLPPTLAAARTAAFAAELAQAELALLAKSSGEEPALATALLEVSAALLGAAQPAVGQLEGGLAAPGVPAAASTPAAAAAPIEAVGGGGSLGERIVRIAETQVGQHEEPLGSNEGPAIARYRSATRGAIPGAPWCAYFVSWVAKQAGQPLGSEGQGLGAVSEIWQWAQETGRAIPNAPGVVPKPGDLIVFGDQHVGIVRRVLPDGMIETIEGNYENKVALNVRSPSEPTGYVAL